MGHVPVLPRVARVAVGAAVDGVVALAAPNVVFAFASGDDVVARACLHVILNTRSRLTCCGVDGVREVGAIPVNVIDRGGLCPLAIHRGGLVVDLFDDLQIHLLVGKTQHLDVLQNVGAIASVALAVDHHERAVLGTGDGVAVGVTRILGHVHAVRTIRIPILRVHQAVVTAIEVVIAFVTPQGVATSAAHQGVVAITTCQSV